MSVDTVLEKKKITTSRLIEPGKYKVIVCNDDVTTMEFVVALLINVFNHTQEQAIGITTEIHNSGSGVAGIYTYEIAEQKSLDGINLARQHGFPLVIKIAPE